jgi:hypothetical protein
MHKQAQNLNRILKAMLPFMDIVLAPFVYPAAILLKLVRLAGVGRLPFCKRALLRVGVFPVRNHYFEPFGDFAIKYHSEQNCFVSCLEAGNCQASSLGD